MGRAIQGSVLVLLLLAACGDDAAPPDGIAAAADAPRDDGAQDGRTADASRPDAAPPDAPCPPEACDGLDDGDCDGLVDNGATCPEAVDTCHEGTCVFPCLDGEFPCPPGYACMTLPEGAYCVEEAP